jgi:hypothetical protein
LNYLPGFPSQGQLRFEYFVEMNENEITSGINASAVTDGVSSKCACAEVW